MKLCLKRFPMHMTAQTGVQAVLAARQRRKAPASAFPSADIMLEGWMEKLVLLHPSVNVEDRYRTVLRDNRPRDVYLRGGQS